MINTYIFLRAKFRSDVEDRVEESSSGRPAGRQAGAGPSYTRREGRLTSVELCRAYIAKGLGL